jgi:ribosomal protein L7/L12
MANKIYFTTFDGALLDNNYIARLGALKDGKAVDAEDLDYIREIAASFKGIKKEVKNPSVNYLLKIGRKYTALKLFRDRHPELSLTQAKEAIDRMEASMRKKVSDEKK